MQLHRLRLVNFRQHADTELEFGVGITGIVGPNGSGKTTLLEALAWAIYGAQAVRGDKDSIRRLGAKGRAPVEVELEFRLGAHEYRVTRGLSTAALHQDGQLVANSLKAVTDKLERTLGMTHDEFFNTYFTGQKELAGLERLQREVAARQAEEAQLEELTRAAAALERRLAELEGVPERLARAVAEATALEERLQAAERVAAEQRTAWVRDRQYAETRRTELLKQYEEVKEQRDQIVQLGPEGTCPTCKRPLGAEYESVLAILDRQLEVITGDGRYFRHRLEQLAQPPAKLKEAEGAREGVLEESRRASAHAGELRAQAEERARATLELAAARGRAHDLERRLRARPGGYDPARHDALRAELAKLEPVALERAALEERARRAESFVREATRAEQQLSVSERRVRELTEAVQAEGFSEAEYKQAKERYDRAMGALREAELAVVESRGVLNRAEDDVREVARRERERAERGRQIAELKARQRLHNELDRSFSDLRGELNARMRPEIAELASGFLADLTDGRYDELELTEDYTVTVLEDGVPKPVISGGEEDLANLVLRLAISQMIAERAGQPLTLLVLDEIFGSLDENRRRQVIGLLRRLADRFPQVVLITHIEQVREGLDRVIRVEYDAARGMSVVRDDTAVLGATDAGVAA